MAWHVLFGAMRHEAAVAILGQLWRPGDGSTCGPSFSALPMSVTSDSPSALVVRCKKRELPLSSVGAEMQILED